jgi:ADP-ribosylglycohydrolase
VGLREQIAGCVYGQALGDAFCMPAMVVMADTRLHFPRIPDGFVSAPAEHGVHSALRPGQITDDTEQAMFLARRIIADGRVSRQASADAVLAWYEAVGGDTLPFCGPSTRRAVARIRAGEPLDRTGAGGDTNGAAMRASFVGALFPGDADAAARAAVETAIPTHNSGPGCAGAAAVAAAVAAALTPARSGGAPAVTLREVITAGVHGAEYGHAIGQPGFGASVARRIELAVSLARDNHGDESARLQTISELVGTSLAASESVPAAFGVLALADGDPMRAARYAFELSGDADTIGAIACAIAGALGGQASIPANLRDVLRAANPAYDFESVIDALYQLAMS